MRRSDLKKSRVNEGLADLADIAERDHEVQMARAELYKIAKHAIKLHEMLKGVSEETGLEGWVQSKITKAADYIDSVYHHLDYEKNYEEKQIATIQGESYKDALADRMYKLAETSTEETTDQEVEEGWFSDSPEEIAQKSPQMKKLLALRDKHQKCYDNYKQIEKRIDYLMDRYSMDQGDVRDELGLSKDVLDPDEFRKANPNF